MARGKRVATPDYSKQLITDVRSLLWVVTVGGLLLAGLCILTKFTGALPWLSAMVGLPWTAHGLICASYMNMAKSDHKEGGVTYETAKATGFAARVHTPAAPVPDTGDSQDSPSI